MEWHSANAAGYSILGEGQGEGLGPGGERVMSVVDCGGVWH